MHRIGFRTAGFHQWPIGQALAELGRVGYDGVEVCLEHPDCRPETLTEADAEGLLRLCVEAGLEVASVSYHADFEPPDERRENTIRAIELVRPFGTEVLIINGRRCETGRESEAREELARLLEALLPRAESLQVGIAIEPEPGLAVGSSEEMRQLIERTASPHLGANLDVGHAFLTDRDVCESIRALRSSLFHTHIEGMPRGEHKHLLPGEGDLDLPAVIQALSDIGYRGYFTVDLFAIADDPLGWAERALAAMRKLLTAGA
jgi:sugar phosphate isomerase/epimerase